MYVCEWDMCWRNFCNFPLVTRNVNSRSKIALFFKWAPFRNLIFKKENNYVFLKQIIWTTQKRPNFACDNYIFPKTRGNKNKQWTHSTHLKPGNLGHTSESHIVNLVRHSQHDRLAKMTTWKWHEAMVFHQHLPTLFPSLKTRLREPSRKVKCAMLPSCLYSSNLHSCILEIIWNSLNVMMTFIIFNIKHKTADFSRKQFTTSKFKKLQEPITSRQPCSWWFCTKNQNSSTISLSNVKLPVNSINSVYCLSLVKLQWLWLTCQLFLF